jgi:hypothetical protein
MLLLRKNHDQQGILDVLRIENQYFMNIGGKIAVMQRLQAISELANSMEIY